MLTIRILLIDSDIDQSFRFDVPPLNLIFKDVRDSIVIIIVIIICNSA